MFPRLLKLRIFGIIGTPAAMPRYIYETTTFLNVDLDLYSRSNLQPLVTAMGHSVIVLHAGRDGRRWCAHLELARVARTADSAIRSFSSLIRRLPSAAGKLWGSATVRDFNIGVQAGMQPRSYEIALARETVETASALKARIVVTVYAPEIPEKGVRKDRRTKRRVS